MHLFADSIALKNALLSIFKVVELTSYFDKNCNEIEFADENYESYDATGDLFIRYFPNITSFNVPYSIFESVRSLTISDNPLLKSIDFEEEDYDTLNGYLIECLDKIPAEGEQYVLQFEGYNFTILSVDNNTIQKVKIEKR